MVSFLICGVVITVGAVLLLSADRLVLGLIALVFGVAVLSYSSASLRRK